MSNGKSSGTFASPAALSIPAFFDGPNNNASPSKKPMVRVRRVSQDF
jgi:hypothetical protein